MSLALGKKVRAPLYDEVHLLSIDVVNASADGDTKKEWKAYNKLRELCISNESTKNDHPLQWEALADFTSSSDQAIVIYQKALLCSDALGLTEYSASIKLEIARRLYESDKIKPALNLAHEADELARDTDNLELRKEISEFILSPSDNT